ncbi:hypothetical protein P153DRAFT_391629 [Dothidotthia symphoricarpi CBS 119687]|uniref:Uncharacterized protein n=1 Tax=Dothidotthia symphoricarpi CBS 119687 TaxID=1392245 RepID=A0A6A5ZWS8_9PLEO|nr:uncharacterized protein P153DRAFT_391629 [Dothidotthia symphoricarpi CBS 119687]KAF2123394.1 hypothetical protein P153DRAFT_391629 [Dothidotthia symphoricarpi CBS 119687]
MNKDFFVESTRSNIKKGMPNIKDWDFKIDLSEWQLESSESGRRATTPDMTVLGRTITGLINEFHTNPAPFMGSKTIIQGIKDANLYVTLNVKNFTITDVITAARYAIDGSFPQGTGGIYIRYHTSTSAAVDFRDRFDSSLSTTSSYGDLARDSQQLLSSALCVMSETDIIDFAYLVEQIFVCLFQSYKSNVLADLGGTAGFADDIEHVEAIQAAFYFRKVSEKVFGETHCPGAINRSSFGVSHGANYSMPFKDWNVTKEQLLFLRHDTFVKCKNTGATIPITVFRRAKSKIAKYNHKNSGSPEAYDIMCAFQKYQAGRSFFSVCHSQKVLDGSMGPRQDEPYQLLFEVRTDGQARPFAWSRLPVIGTFQNWDQGRSLAVRIEWEYPPKSGEWRYRYLYAHKVYTFEDKHMPGSHVNYIKTIAMVQWLFNAVPNKPQPWMPRLRGYAHVLQTVYNGHTQTIEVKLQKPFTMRSGALKPKASIVAAMNAFGLDNVDGPFRQHQTCDGCAMLSPETIQSLGYTCIQIPGTDCCLICMLFGRPCCSWTENGAVRGGSAYSTGMITGEVSTEGNVTSTDVALNRKYRAALHCQPIPKSDVQGQFFSQQLIDVMNLTRLEDDLSDVEDADGDLEDEGDEDFEY